MRFCPGGHSKDKVQMIISTKVMILATIRRGPPPAGHTPHTTFRPQLTTRKTMPAICHQPHTSQFLASATQQVSQLGMQENTWDQIVKWDWKCLSSSECPCEQLGGVLGGYSEVLLGVSWERTWGRTVKRAGRVPSSAIGSVLERVLGSVIESVQRAYLRAYSQTGCKSAIECNWECTWERARQCDWEHPESSLGSVL